MRIDLTYWMALHVSENHELGSSTWRAKTSDFKHYIRFLSEEHGFGMPTLGHLTPALAREFADFQLDAEYAPATVNRHLASLLALNTWIRDLHPELKLPKLSGDAFITMSEGEPRCLSEVEIEKLRNAINAIREPFQRERVSFCFEFLLATGLRRHELLKLPLSALQGKWIRGVKGKGRKFRDVYIDDSAHEAIKVWLFLRERALQSRGIREGGKSLPLVVGFRDGRSTKVGMSPEWLGYWFRQIAATSGVADFSAHTLRHTRAQILMDKTKDISLVAGQLGHSSVQTTMRYLRRKDDDIEKKLRA